MRFNLIFNFHKNIDWNQFYFEYNELREYLKKARDFFNLEIEKKYHEHPSNKELRKICEKQEEDNHNEHENNVQIDIEHNDLCLKSTSANLTECKSVKYFSKGFFNIFKEKLKKVEDFFVAVKNDLNHDFEKLKNLVSECEDVEVIILLFI